MAGIGFELRRLLRPGSYLGLLRAYAYAGVISSGPWVLSIVGVLVIGFLSLGAVASNLFITQFQVSVTYLIVGSLCLTGGVQLAFTRFAADRLFEKRREVVLPNFNGVLLVTSALAGLIGAALLVLLFAGTSTVYRLLMLAGFVLLCCIWVGTVLLSALKHYGALVSVYAAGYVTAVVAAIALRGWGTEGLLAGFVAGHGVLLAGMLAMIWRAFPAERFVSLDFLRPRAMYGTLFAAGIGYNLAVWADKALFWLNPGTGQTIVGPLRASVIYDLPVFLAYLSIIPGMAVFLVRIETDFAEYYQRFYEAVREGSTLNQIEELRDEMVHTIRQGLSEIVKVQGVAMLLTFVAGPAFLRWLGISAAYTPLLYVDVIAAGMQVLLLAVLNVFFYLDQRRDALLLILLFLISNVGLTAATLRLGPAFFGYGFALSLLVTVVAGMMTLDRKLERLEYETFMLQ